MFKLEARNMHDLNHKKIMSYNRVTLYEDDWYLRFIAPENELFYIK